VAAYAGATSRPAALQKLGEDSIVVEEGSIAFSPSVVQEKAPSIYDAALEQSVVIDVSFGDEPIPKVPTAARER
jgi:hypothetical protein